MTQCELRLATPSELEETLSLVTRALTAWQAEPSRKSLRLPFAAVTVTRDLASDLISVFGSTEAAAAWAA